MFFVTAIFLSVFLMFYTIGVFTLAKTNRVIELIPKPGALNNIAHTRKISAYEILINIENRSRRTNVTLASSRG